MALQVAMPSHQLASSQRPCFPTRHRGIGLFNLWVSRPGLAAICHCPHQGVRGARARSASSAHPQEPAAGEATPTVFNFNTQSSSEGGALPTAPGSPSVSPSGSITTTPGTAPDSSTTTSSTSTTPGTAPGSTSTTSSTSTTPGSSTSTTPGSSSTGTSDATSTGPPGYKELVTVFAAIAAFLASLWASAGKILSQVHAQKLKKLQDASDEDPKDADKHAAFLLELNKVAPKDVVTRVETREYASNGVVVSEYLKALVNTGKLSQYTATNASPNSSEDHKSLSQLLKDLQAQVASEQVEDMPGGSLRRPLHVTLQGGGLPMQTRPSGPLQMVWQLLSMLFLVVGLSFAWLVGAQAVRRAQVVAPATTTSTSAGGMGSGGPATSTDPKEYKREELPEKALRAFKDVRGCEEAKEELKEVVEFLKNPAKFTRLGAKLPKGVLLTGPPGTGKTLLARAVAGEAGVPFFYRAGSEFEELYVGVGSRRMRALFAAAKKKAPCIVFIDEIDAIGGNRKHWENHSRKTLNQLLVEMDGFESNDGVIVMAATNLAETLDPALKRPGRFDREVAVPLPDVAGRTDIIDYYLNEKPVTADVDRDLLARQTQGFSGADLSNLVNEAALLAAKQGADFITPAMFDSSFDKIRMGVERKSVRRTAEAVKRTAYHEAGHALVAMATPGATPVHKATIVPRGHALGMVTQVGREDEFSINRQQMIARIWVCMGGQVAEEVIFGRDQITSGATDDLRQATEWARYMVAECGLNEEIGPVFVSEGSARTGVMSEHLKQRIDDQVRSMLVEARQGVFALLTTRLADLHAVAGELIEKETLTFAQIKAVLDRGASEAGGAAGGGVEKEAGEHEHQPVASGLLDILAGDSLVALVGDPSSE